MMNRVNNRFLIRNGLFVLSFLFSTFVFAQDKTKPIHYERLTKFPLFSSSFAHYPVADLGTGKVNVDVLENVANLAFPIKAKKTYVSVRFVHSFFKLKTDFDNQNFRLNETYQSFELGGGLIKILPKHWRLITTFSPTLASDFKTKIHKDDWIYRSNILATKRANANTSYTFGVLFTTRFGNPLVLPMLGYTHKKNKWTTNILLPAFASVRKQVWNDMHIGLKMTIESNVYNAHLKLYNFNNNQINRLAYTRILVGPEVLLPIYKSVYLQFTGGVSLRNVFETQDQNLNNGISLEAKTRSFFKFGIIVLK